MSTLKRRLARWGNRSKSRCVDILPTAKAGGFSRNFGDKPRDKPRDSHFSTGNPYRKPLPETPGKPRGNPGTATLLGRSERVQRYRAHPEGLCAAELARVDLWVTTYRERLMDLSWFMRVLHEPIARQANAEDGVTGRFWEGRFKSHALLDEAAVLTAMAYVDLNPIRARLATVPEDSAFTSIAERLQEADAPKGDTHLA